MTPETTEDRGHSELGSSGAKIWSNCTGSIFLKRQVKEEPAGPWAAEGTLAHTVAENELRVFLYHKIHGSHIARGNPPETTPEMLEHAHAYKDAIWVRGLEESITGKAYGLEDQLFIDRSLDIYGYADFWCVYTDDRGRRAGLVVDYKYGFVGVSADSNAQLAHLALGLRQEMRARGKDLDYVRGAIFQPRSPTTEDNDPYSEFTFTAKALDRWHKKFLNAAHAIYVDKKPKFAVGEWCQYCKGKSLCGKYAKVLSKKTDLALADTSPIGLPPVETLSKEVIEKIVLCGDDVEDFIKACRARAHAELAAGEEYTQIKRVYGSSRRKWIDDESKIISTVSDAFLHLGHTTPPPLFEQSLLPLTTVEKELNKLIDKKEAAAIMAELTYPSQPSVKLVSIEDPRPAIEAATKLLDD